MMSMVSACTKGRKLICWWDSDTRSSTFWKGEIKWLSEVAEAKHEWDESRRFIHGPVVAVFKFH